MTVAAAAASLLLGRYPRPGFIGPASILSDPLAGRLVMDIRLPRVLTALLLGAVLAGGGAVFQMLFSNPLVEPGFLGVSQGAAFGAALAIVTLGGSRGAVQICASGFALLGLAVSYGTARRIRYGGWLLRLLLAGIAVSALFTAGLGFLKFTADPLNQLPDITFWLLGGLWAVTWRDFLGILPAGAAGLLVMFLMRWRLNVLSLDSRVARSLGASPGRERLLLLFAVTIPVAAVISVCGLVGWIGLIVPHLARRLFRTDGRHSIPAAMLLGALFALACDNLARTLLAGEIPVGIPASFFGAAFFLLVFMKKGVRTSDRHG